MSRSARDLSDSAAFVAFRRLPRHVAACVGRHPLRGIVACTAGGIAIDDTCSASETVDYVARSLRESRRQHRSGGNVEQHCAISVRYL